jgi:hypothetical protein
MYAQLPSLVNQYGNILGNLPDVSTLTNQLQSTLTNLPSTGAVTDPLYAALQRNAGIVSSGGAMTAQEAASLNAPLTAELGQAGMGRTAPGVFTQAMNTYNEMQNRVNTAIGQEIQLGPAIEEIQAKDAATRSLIPQAIEQIRSQDVGLRQQLLGGIQGAETTAQGALIGAEQAGVGDFSALLGNIGQPVASQVLANQQAQAANVAAANNKNAGIGSGAAEIGAAAILAA